MQPGPGRPKYRVMQNTEGEYSGLEHQVTDGVVESLKVQFILSWMPAFAYSQQSAHRQQSLAGR